MSDYNFVKSTFSIQAGIFWYVSHRTKTYAMYSRNKYLPVNLLTSQQEGKEYATYAGFRYVSAELF